MTIEDKNSLAQKARLIRRILLLGSLYHLERRRYFYLQRFGEVCLEIFEDRVKISSEAVKIEVEANTYGIPRYLLGITLESYLMKELEKIEEELKKL